jgi:hypothetical protein
MHGPSHRPPTPAEILVDPTQHREVYAQSPEWGNPYATISEHGAAAMRAVWRPELQNRLIWRLTRPGREAVAAVCTAWSFGHFGEIHPEGSAPGGSASTNRSAHLRDELAVAN